MKLFVFSALVCVVSVTTIVLSSCAPTVVNRPTPFVIGEEMRPIKGCIDLRNEVDAWNKKNPHLTKKADC
jgi:hypothetical protein